MADALQDSQFVTARRTGRPPLRFKGALASRHAVPLSNNREISIELWSRPSGGYAVSITLPGTEGMHHDVDLFKSLDQAMDFAEAKARPAPVKQQTKRKLGIPEAIAAYEDVQLFRHEKRALEALLGDALAAWDEAMSQA